MIILPFDYKTPKTVEEACDLLWKAGGKAKIVAGGTDLVIGLRNGDQKPKLLVDVTRIKELRTIEESNGTLLIGAAVTHSEIGSSSLVKKFGKVLSDAASEVGSPQIRNVGTIGGNIVNASPAADTIPPLMVLNAIGRVASRGGIKEVPLFHLFKGPYQTNLNPKELLVQILFPKLSSGVQTSFIRLARRDAMAIARMSIAVILQVEGNRLREVRIAAGSVTPTPKRMSEAEAFLKGKVLSEEFLQEASLRVSESMIRQSGIRPSTSYKKPVVEALFIRAMKQALGNQK